MDLLHGPYYPPRVRRGDTLSCEIRGLVEVGGYTTAPIPWPRVKKTGRACLILCGDLVRAVRTESELAIAEHWGVGLTTIWSWRKALGVGRMTEGTRELYCEAMPRKLTPERVARGREAARMPAAVEKIRRSKIGKPMHPRTREALLKAARRPKSEGWRLANSKSMRRQWADGTRTAGKDLTPLQRRAWELHMQGLKPREIAKAMGRRRENVRQLIARARNKIERG